MHQNQNIYLMPRHQCKWYEGIYMKENQEKAWYA